MAFALGVKKQTTTPGVTLFSGKIPGASGLTFPTDAASNSVPTTESGAVKGASTGDTSTVLASVTPYNPFNSSSNSSTGTGAMSSVIDQAIGTAKDQARRSQELASTIEAAKLAGKDKEVATIMAMIDARMPLLTQNYNEGVGTVNQGFQRNVDLLNKTTDQGNQAIDQGLATTQTALEGQKKDIKETAARTRSTTEDALVRNFGARGALDSSFFAKALAEGFANVSEQEMKNLQVVGGQLNAALSEASTQKANLALKKEDVMNTLLERRDTYLANLKQQYDQGRISLETLKMNTNIDAAQFATNADIEKLSTIQNVQFALEDRINTLNANLADYQAKMSAYTSTSTNNYTAAQQNIERVKQDAATILTNGGVGGRDALLRQYVSSGFTQEQATNMVQQAEEYIRNLRAGSGLGADVTGTKEANSLYSLLTTGQLPVTIAATK